jgi:hypothetical protein
MGFKFSLKSKRMNESNICCTVSYYNGGERHQIFQVRQGRAREILVYDYNQ